MEQRAQRPNLFGLCRVVTEEDEVNLFGLCRAPRNECRITKPLLTSIRHLQSDKWSVTAFLMTYSYNVKNCHILPQERLFLHREDIFTLRTIRKEARLSLPKIPYDPQKGREFQPCKLRAKLQTYFEKQDNSNNNNVLTT